MSITKTNGELRTRSLFPKISDLKDLFNVDLSIPKWGNGLSTEWIPAANVKESENEFIIELSVPGYTKEDFHVKVDSNNVLRITGERKEETKEEKDNYTRKEFSYGSFTRSFQLPETVIEGEIAAKCKEGVLTLELPKKEVAIEKRKIKEIEIS